MGEKIIIPMYRLWLHGLYGLYGPQCLLSPKRPINLTHWGRVTHICVGNLTIIGPDNGLSPGRRQAINRTNAGILLIGTLGTNFSEILIEILIVSFKKMCFKVSSAKRRPFCLGLNVLISLSHVSKRDLRHYQCTWNILHRLSVSSLKSYHNAILLSLGTFSNYTHFQKLHPHWILVFKWNGCHSVSCHEFVWNDKILNWVVSEKRCPPVTCIALVCWIHYKCFMQVYTLSILHSIT